MFRTIASLSIISFHYILFYLSDTHFVYYSLLNINENSKIMFSLARSRGSMNLNKSQRLNNQICILSVSVSAI